MLRTIALFASILVVGIAGPSYARMAPLDQYLIADRQVEVALARSAAPPAISRHAAVLVLTATGYDTAAPGTNGFTCLVERGWTAPFDNPDFWNWKLRGPICYNSAATRTVLKDSLLRTKWVLAGVGKTEMLDRLRAAIASKQLPAAAPGSMAYMMSKAQYLGDAPKSWYPHLMLYAPTADAANAGESWGANRRGSPVVLDTSDHVVPEPWTIFYVPVSHWSDGSAGPAA